MNCFSYWWKLVFPYISYTIVQSWYKKTQRKKLFVICNSEVCYNKVRRFAEKHCFNIKSIIRFISLRVLSEWSEEKRHILKRRAMYDVYKRRAKKVHHRMRCLHYVIYISLALNGCFYQFKNNKFELLSILLLFMNS